MAEDKREPEEKALDKAEPRQKELPGMEKDIVKIIEKLAEAFVRARNARQRLTIREGELHDRLRLAMKRKGIKTYEFDGQIISVDRGEDKVHVRKIDEKKEQKAERKAAKEARRKKKAKARKAKQQQGEKQKRGDSDL